MTGWGEGDDLEKMERLRDQAQHHMRGRTPTLESQYAYYLEQAKDTSHTAKDRRLWSQLAEELANRLGLNAPPSKQEELWEDPPIEQETR